MVARRSSDELLPYLAGHQTPREGPRSVRPPTPVSILDGLFRATTGHRKGVLNALKARNRRERNTQALSRPDEENNVKTLSLLLVAAAVVYGASSRVRSLQPQRRHVVITHAEAAERRLPVVGVLGSGRVLVAVHGDAAGG